VELPETLSRNIICFIHFLFVGGYFFIRSCRKHECICLEINRACFYPLRISLDIPILHMLTRFHRTRRPILMLQFYLKSIFVSRFSNIYYYSLTFRVLACLGTNFIYTWSRQDRQNRVLSSFSHLSFFWKVPFIIFTRNK